MLRAECRTNQTLGGTGRTRGIPSHATHHGIYRGAAARCCAAACSSATAAAAAPQARTGRLAPQPGTNMALMMRLQQHQTSHISCALHRSSRAAAASAAAVALSSTSMPTGTMPVAAAATAAAAGGPVPVDDLPTAPAAYRHMTYLQEMRVSDFALVPSAVVSFTPGLNAISGSSGAGKSLLLDALQQLLGAAANADCVRHPADMAVVEGVWWLGPGVAAAAAELLAGLGLPGKALPGVWGAPGTAAAGGDGGSAAAGGGGVLHIRREICRLAAGSGGGSTAAAAAAASTTRSRVLINGSPSSLRVLRSLGSLLIDVNGQHASLALRDSATQLQLLDRIAGTTGLVPHLSQSVSRLSQLESRLADVDALGHEDTRTALQRRVELVQRAGITPGEEVQLRRRLAAMESRRGCLEAAAAVQTGIQGDTSGASSTSAGSSGLMEGLRLVTGQLRSVLAAEQQQQRLAAQEREQRQQARRSRTTSSSSSGNGRSSSPVIGNSSSSLRSSRDEGEQQYPAASAPGGAAGDGDEDEELLDDGSGGDDGGGRSAELSSSAAALAALQAALDELELAAEALSDAQGQLSVYAGVAGYSAAEAAEVTARLDIIDKLCRRFRVRGTSELLSMAEGWSAQLEAYYDSLGQQEQWRSEAAALQASITKAALQLSGARAAAAGRLATAVQGCLSQLAMSASRFGVDMQWSRAGPADEQAGPSSRAVLAPTAAQPTPLLAADSAVHNSSTSDTDNSSSSDSSSSALFRLTPSGLDSVTFMLAPGPSEPLRPLAATASGGEAARIMLALKAAPAAAAAAVRPSDTTTSSSSSSGDAVGAGLVSVGPPVLVMDELDAGLGSRLGEPVGRLLAGLVGAGNSSGNSGSSSGGVSPAACQVLVVTHTPQVAAHATHHIQVVKGAADDGRVITAFKHLATDAERQSELADMLGLGTGDGTQLAAELLAAARTAAATGAGGVLLSTTNSNSRVDNEGENLPTAADAQRSEAVASSAAVGGEGDQQQLLGSSACSSHVTLGGAEAAGQELVHAVAPAVTAAADNGADCISSNRSGSSSELPAGASSRWLMGITAAAAAAGVAAAGAGSNDQSVHPSTGGQEAASGDATE